MHKPRFFCFEKFQDFQNYMACALMFNTDLLNTDENRRMNKADGCFMLPKKSTKFINSN